MRRRRWTGSCATPRPEAHADTESSMADPIDFYFDFSSPYGYLASTRIDALAARHGRAVVWRPFLLGVAFKTTGQAPAVEPPLRGPYHRHDFARSARLLGVPFQIPAVFPFAALAASRAYYWLVDRDAAQARTLAPGGFFPGPPPGPGPGRPPGGAR